MKNASEIVFLPLGFESYPFTSQLSHYTNIMTKKQMSYIHQMCKYFYKCCVRKHSVSYQPMYTNWTVWNVIYNVKIRLRTRGWKTFLAGGKSGKKRFTLKNEGFSSVQIMTNSNDNVVMYIYIFVFYINTCNMFS